MPVFAENPAEFSKQRLKSELICHNVKLPPAGSATQVYLQVYMKHVGNKTNADFSSDDDEQVQNGNEEEKTGQDLDQDSDMVDLSSLTDDQLKCKLLQYGVKAGPIVATTRGLYERKLSRMMTQHLHHRVNSKANAEKYSESEEEGEEAASGSEQLGPECAAHTDLGATPSTEAVTDVLMEMFSDTAMTPAGITATKRRSIKGAAGRPVQFKYPETPLSPATLEKREIQQRLVPLWVQIVVFLLVVALLYIIYISIEEPLGNPFSALLQGLSQEPSSNDLEFVSQDTHA